MKYVLVFFGAGFGGTFRYLISAYSNRLFNLYFPTGTLIVNVVGSFLIGLIIFGLDMRGLLRPELKLLLAVGFCGGFTTFSSFSLETVMLLRSSQFLLAFLNIFLNFILTISGIYLGYVITR